MPNVYMTDGSLIQRETSPGSGTFTTIPQCMTFTPPERNRKTADVYIHDQSTPITKTGAYEPMEVPFTFAWDPQNAAHQQFFADADAKTERNYKLVLPDSGSATSAFAAIVSNLKPSEMGAEGTEAMQLQGTLKLSGADTWTW